MSNLKDLRVGDLSFCVYLRNLRERKRMPADGADLRRGFGFFSAISVSSHVGISFCVYQREKKDFPQIAQNVNSQNSRQQLKSTTSTWRRRRWAWQLICRSCFQLISIRSTIAIGSVSSDIIICIWS